MCKKSCIQIEQCSFCWNENKREQFLVATTGITFGKFGLIRAVSTEGRNVGDCLSYKKLRL